MTTTATRRTTVWVYDLAGTQTGAISSKEMLDISHDERLDQSQALTFEIPATSPKLDLLAVDTEIAWNGERFFVHEVEDARSGATATRKITARALWYRLGDAFKVGSLLVSAKTPREGLEVILDGTGWSVGSPTTTTSDQFTIEESDRSVLSLLRSWARVTGRSLVWNTAERSVAVVDVRGRDLGLGFRYARNLREIRRRVTPPAATVLYPFGAQDLTIAGVNGGKQFLEDFSFYTSQGLSIDEARARHTRTKVLSDPSFVEENALLAWGAARLGELAHPVVSFECSVVDLSEITQVSEDPRVGDRVRVFDPDFGQDLRTTVVRIVKYPTAPWRNEIELAYLVDPIGDGSSSSRPSTALAWEQFIANNLSPQQIRNDFTFQVSRLPLAFRPGGRANFHLDISATGVGSGVMVVEIVDAISDEVQHRPLEIPYADGQLVHDSAQWAFEDLDGEKDYRVRVTALATGGPLVGSGVNIAADELRFWVLAQGAVRQTPVTPTSELFEWTGPGDTTTGVVQFFQVPDGITEITVTAAGAGGSSGGDGQGGAGALLRCVVPVTPGEILDVYVAGSGVDVDDDELGGWPNGGNGRTGSTGGTNGPGGGGSSHVVRNGLGFASAILVAAGGGGAGYAEPFNVGGAGGIFAGSDGSGNGISGTRRQGLGATQFAGGVGGEANDGQDTSGGFNRGGNAGINSNSFSGGGGGGGGGWYGGGGAGDPSGLGNDASAGGGGGGSSWWDPNAAIPELLTDGGGGGSDENGSVLIEWKVPDAL